MIAMAGSARRSWAQPGAAQTSVDLIVHNAKVTTLQSGTPEAEAFAVRGERIVAVGGEADRFSCHGASPPLSTGLTHDVRDRVRLAARHRRVGPLVPIRLRKAPETRQTREIDMRALIAKIVHGAVDSFAEAMLGPGDDELALKARAGLYRAVAEAWLDEAKQIDLLTTSNERYQARN